MPFTEDFYLPSEEDLTVEEVKLSTPSLKAGAVHFGKYCDDQCKEFMLCKAELVDPRQCINEGKAVTACAIDFFQKVKKGCRKEFEAYADCLEYYSPGMDIQYCRKTQGILDQCMLEKLNIERPYFGYFTEIRVHKTDRPRPPNYYLPRKEYRDDRPTFPAFYPQPESKYGASYISY